MPRGTPDFGKYGFKAKGDEPLTSQIAFKATASFHAKLKAKENWQEFARETLAKALEAESA